MKKIALVFCFCLLSSGAYATGGTSCDIDDENLSFSFAAGQNREGIGNWFNVQASLKAKAADIPEEFRTLAFGDGDVSMRWADRDEVRLEVQKNSQKKDAFGWLRLTIRTVSSEESFFRGGYLLEIETDGNSPGAEQDRVTLEGFATCVLD